MTSIPPSLFAVRAPCGADEPVAFNDPFGTFHRPPSIQTCPFPLYTAFSDNRFLSSRIDITDHNRRRDTERENEKKERKEGEERTGESRVNDVVDRSSSTSSWLFPWKAREATSIASSPSHTLHAFDPWSVENAAPGVPSVRSLQEMEWKADGDPPSVLQQANREKLVMRFLLETAHAFGRVNSFLEQDIASEAGIVGQDRGEEGGRKYGALSMLEHLSPQEYRKAYTAVWDVFHCAMASSAVLPESKEKRRRSTSFTTPSYCRSSYRPSAPASSTHTPDEPRVSHSSGSLSTRRLHVAGEKTVDAISPSRLEPSWGDLGSFTTSPWRDPTPRDPYLSVMVCEGREAKGKKLKTSSKTKRKVRKRVVPLGKVYRFSLFRKGRGRHKKISFHHSAKSSAVLLHYLSFAFASCIFY